MNSNSRLQPCPACDEPISKQAYKCPHCDHVLKIESNSQIIPWILGVMVAVLVVVGVVQSGLLGGNSTEPTEINVAQDDWPNWRGPQLNNVARGESPPTIWTSEQNVVWKSPVEGLGHGSPIVVGERVFLQTANDSEESMSLVCLNRSDGKSLWDVEIHHGGLMHKNLKNSYASSTPACDGEHVFTTFITKGGLWLTAVNLEGKIAWQKLVAPFESEHGFASSPLIYKSLVIVAGDNLQASYLTAFNRKNGSRVWQVERQTGGSYGSPVFAKIDRNDQLLLAGQGFVTSYNPADGQTLWSCRAMSPSMIGTMAWRDNLVYATSLNGTMCIRADGVGDVSNTHVVWGNRVKANVPSPLVVGERLIVVQDEGIVNCLDVTTGDSIWKQRLGGNISASPVLAGDHVYVPNEDGIVFVFKVADGFELVAENDLGDTGKDGFATPVICGGRIYLRAENHVYCIGE